MDDLTEFELAELKQNLIDLEIHLEAISKAGQAADKTVDLDLPIGRLTRIDAIQQQEMDEAGRRQAAMRHKLVKTVLALFADDEYGYCKQCEEPIGYKRLKARPEALFCVECQNNIEKR